MKEAGLPGYVYTTWYGLWAPANTPPEIVDGLNATLRKILRYADVKDTLLKAGIIAEDRPGRILKSSFRPTW